MIRLIKSSFYHEKETKEALVEFMKNAEIFSMNTECQKYEERFATKQGCKYAAFVSSGSMANLILIQAMLNLGRLKKGDKVGFSTLTWATNVMPIIQLGLVPVPFDCEIKTLNVSREILEESGEDIKALFLTNVLGFADDIQRVADWCKENGVVFMEDNCESLGSAVNNKLLGNFGIASTFSHFVGHHISTIEGGFICTDDKELYDMCVMVRAHGWDRNLDENSQESLRNENKIDDFFARYTFYDLAYNGRPTEINGFIGNTQIGYWDEIVSRRENNFNRFQKVIESNDDFLALDVSHMSIVSNFAMPVVCKDNGTFLTYRSRFEEAGIEIRPIIAGDITQQPFYKKYMGDGGSSFAGFPNSGKVHKNGFYFPNNPELSEEEITLLVSLLCK